MRAVYSLLLRLEAILAGVLLMLMVLLIFTGGIARLLNYANLVIIALFLGYAIWAGIALSRFSWARSFQGIPGVSYSWVTMSISFGSALLLLTTLLKLRDLLRTDGLLPAPGERRAP